MVLLHAMLEPSLSSMGVLVTGAGRIGPDLREARLAIYHKAAGFSLQQDPGV